MSKEPLMLAEPEGGSLMDFLDHPLVFGAFALGISYAYSVVMGYLSRLHEKRMLRPYLTDKVKDEPHGN